MKYVWPPLQKAMQARQAEIAEGLAAAERGVRRGQLLREQLVERQQAGAQAVVDVVGVVGDVVGDGGERRSEDNRESDAREIQPRGVDSGREITRTINRRRRWRGPRRRKSRAVWRG